METTEEWEALEAPGGAQFPWDAASLFIRPSPFPRLGPALDPSAPLSGARALLVLGDSITTDHISPNGAIRKDSPAGQYLIAGGADPARLGNYGARRGNADVCALGMFDNALLLNELVGRRGNLALDPEGGKPVPIHEAARRHGAAGTPLVIVAGRNYGAGSSRDWAAKGLRLLGVVAVIAESFERIHRSNLLGMGILPLRLPEGTTRAALRLAGSETIDIVPPASGLGVRASVEIRIAREGGGTEAIETRLDAASPVEIDLIRAGGILPSILARLAARAAPS
jgi:aconitate hydratase